MDLATRVLNENKNVIAFVKNIRRKFNKKILSLKVGVLIILPSFIFLQLVDEPDVNAIMLLYIMLGVIFATFILIFPVNNEKLLSPSKKRELFRISKMVLANILLKCIDRHINYFPTKRILNKPIINSKLFKSKISNIKGSDLMVLEANDMIFELSMLKVLTGAKSIFEGIFIHIESNRGTINPTNLETIDVNMKWKIIDNELFIAIPCKTNKFLSVELKTKENNMQLFYKQFNIISEFLQFFQKLSNYQFQPIESDAKSKLLDKYEIEFIEDVDMFASDISRVYNLLLDILFINIYSIVVIFFLALANVITENNIYVLLVFFIVYLLYYIAYEYLINKTIGKMITKTIVVNLDNAKPSFKQILIRTFTRLIPFDFYSFIRSDMGWHDKLSKTKVIYKSFKEMKNNEDDK